MDVRFKIATVDDVENIIRLCDECFDENTDLEYAKRMFLETKDNQNDIYVIGEVDGNVVAHTKITIIKTIYQTRTITATASNMATVRSGKNR